MATAVSADPIENTPICHNPGPNQVTIIVDNSAVYDMHLNNHGDVVGVCEGSSSTCDVNQTLYSCTGTPNACTTYDASGTCSAAGCSWTSTPSPSTPWSENFASVADWTGFDDENDGISHETGNDNDCIDDSNDACIQVDDNDDGVDTITTSANIDLSSCLPGTAEFNIAKVVEASGNNLESDDCVYVDFSSNSGSTFGADSVVFCNDDPASTFSVPISNSYLTSTTRFRLQKSEFDGTNEEAFLDGFSITCDTPQDACTGSPSTCGSYTNDDACFDAGCDVTCRDTTFCGDGITQNPNDAQVAETCDNGAQNGVACDPAYGDSCSYCSSACAIVELTGDYCGDGQTNGAETCDDGNQVNDDACNNLCVLNVCGDLIVNNGEVCDGGACCNAATCQYNDGKTLCRGTAGVCDAAEYCTGSSASCPADTKIGGGSVVCRSAAGVCDADELCDGQTNDCPADAFQPVNTSCIDSDVCNGNEVCDGSGACVSGTPLVCAPYSCSANEGCYGSCGDGIVNGAEACEVGDQVADPEHYSCNAQTCALDYVPYCGDNNVDQGEQCDAGNQTGNYCTPGYGESCTFCGINCINDTITGPFCGDDIMNGAEECDGEDGVGAHESCGETCLIVPLPYCGDSTINQQSETCDDGNNVDNDGCSATCTLEQLQSCEEQGGVQTCVGEANACDSYVDSQSCTFAGCDWSASQGQNDVTQWSESFASPASDWSPYVSIGNGISHIANDHVNCINDANDDCIKFNGDGTPAASNISKQSNVDLSACTDGSAVFRIAKIKEYGELESDDCAHVWFSADGGSTWGDKTLVFCNDGPASTYSTSVPDAYLTAQMRIRMERINFGGNDERAYFDGLSITCDIAGESACEGDANACSAYNDNEQACLTAGCDTACEIPQVYCGDGIVNQQNETCDAGVNNGITCDPAYGNSCSYCDNACQPVNLTGGYCGDLITNGEEECDGSAPDGFVCTENCALDELTCEDLAIVVVSDTQTLLADGNNSVAAWVHPGWTASVNGATWVWESEFIADPSVETRANFTRTFVLPGSVDSATLRVAADNGYTVWLNGVQVGADPEEFNYLAGHEDTYDVASGLVVGVNTLLFEVVNHPYSTQDPQINPAALLYRLETGSDLCAYCGDGIVNQESEQCDGIDGVGAHQECNSDCNLVNLPYCGDGVVNQESEECDLQAGVPEGYTCFQDCSLHLTCEEAKSQGLLYGEIDSEGHAIAHNDADEDFLITLASYEMYAPLIEDQVLYSSDSQIVEGDSSAEFSVTVPACAYQIDLICGEPLPNNPVYTEEEKLDFAFSEGLEYCVPDEDEDATLVVLEGFPQCGNYVFSCDAQGFEATNYYWYFGDGQIQPNSTNSDVYHTYEDDGSYTVTCTATNGEQSASASIEIEAVTCPTCEEAIAMGLLTGEIDSEGHAIVHNDANINYTVSLASYEMYALLIEDQVLFDSDTTDIASGGDAELSVEVPACTYQIDLVCGSPLPFAPLYGDRVIDFDFANQEAAFCVPTGHEDEVTVDLSIGDGFPQGADYVFACDADGFVPTGYYWYFGDGQIQPNSPNDNVWHTYTANGDYIVACTATNGTTWQTDTLLVSVEGIVDPSVTVSVDPEYPQGPAYVFLCEADGFTPLGYDWDFGDGEYLYDQLTADVYHEFSANGEYTVTCTASDGETTESGNTQVVVETCGEYELLITQVDPNPAAPETPFTVSGTLTVGGLPVETETVVLSFDEASQDASVLMGAWLGGFNAPTTPGEYLVSASFNGTCGEPVTASTMLFVEIPQEEGGNGEDELFQTESVEQPLAGSPESNSDGGCAWGYHESDGMCVKNAPAVNTLAFDGGNVAGGNGDGELLPEESLTEDGLPTEGDDTSGDLLTGAVIGGGLLSWSWLLVLIAIVAILGGAYWWQQR